MAGRIELPFLYQTRTILRRSAVTVRLTRRRCLATQAHKDTAGEDENSSLSYAGESFLKQKARQAAGTTAAPKSLLEIVDTGINSTITASERRAFESILQFAPKQSEPVGVKNRSPYVDALDTDIENILDIFSSSVRDYHAERDLKASRHQEPDTPELSTAVSRATPKIDTAQHVSQRVLSYPEPDHLDETTEQQSSVTITPAHPNQIDVSGRGHPSDANTPARTPAPFPASRSLGRSSHTAGQPDLETKEDRLLAERSFAEITKHRHLDRFDKPIQEAVRKCMTDISTALQAAAISSTQRGDLAMWTVCETQIFSLASYLQPTTPQLPRFTGPKRLKFSADHSDDAAELIGAAEREQQQRQHQMYITTIATIENLPVTHHDLSSEESQSLISLTILHHVYPSALLLALRLYIKHFPSSPLPHNLLPQIRSLGHTSYVLGASTQFYNSLMALVWQTRSSLREVDALLTDMERGGVDLNEETYRILRQIEDERAADVERAEARAGLLPGSRGDAWWKRHEQMFWFPRILDWLGVVSKRLNMKEFESGLA